jgi:hypothetical protein
MSKLSSVKGSAAQLQKTKDPGFENTLQIVNSFQCRFGNKFREAIEMQRVDTNGKFSESYIYKTMLDEAYKFDLRSTVFPFKSYHF